MPGSTGLLPRTLQRQVYFRDGVSKLQAKMHKRWQECHESPLDDFGLGWPIGPHDAIEEAKEGYDEVFKDFYLY